MGDIVSDDVVCFCVTFGSFSWVAVLLVGFAIAGVASGFVAYGVMSCQRMPLH